MIVLYDERGRELGRYDNASDVWQDYPEATVKNKTAYVKGD